MGLRDCLNSAVAQGAISKQEASMLGDDFEERFAQHRLSLGDGAAAAKARQELEHDLRMRALEKKRTADLSEAARLSVLQRLQSDAGKGEVDPFRAAVSLLSHYGFRNGTSMRGKAEAIQWAAHAKLSEVMFIYRRSLVLGNRPNKALEIDMVRERFGQHSGDATAKSLSNAIEDVFEDLRLRFNAAGGAIGKLEKFGLPQSHDRTKVKAKGRIAWKDYIRPMLDVDAMRDPLTGTTLGPSRLESLLDHAFDNIVSDGRAHIKPSSRGISKGSIASQRADERILIFKSADDWMEYHRAAGKGDVIQVIFNHINGMAKDIAAMETLGPNPAAMVEYIKQFVSREFGRKDADLPTTAKAGVFLKDSQAAYAENYLDALYQSQRGTPTVVTGFAQNTTDVKNVVTGTVLGGASITAAATDPVISRSARLLGGLPVTQNAFKMLAMLREGTRDEIVRSGIGWGEYMHVMADEIRFAGPQLGSDWSKYLADRMVTWSGLKPLTTGRKLLEARAWQGHIADLAKQKVAFDQLDPRFKRALDGFGITQEHWNVWIKAIDSNGFVTARQMELLGGSVSYLDNNKFQITDPQYIAEAKALQHRDAAEKLSEFISSWSERSVPEGTPNARAVVTSTVARGTIPGELAEYALQFKSFGLSLTTLQLEAIGEMASARGGGTGYRTGLAYFAGLAVPLTIAGGISMHLRAIGDGKDPQDMSEPDFWIRAALTGGGFGLFGDFVKSTENRFGQQMTSAVSGPGLNLLNDVFQLTVGNAMELASRQKDADGNLKSINFGRETTKFLGRWTPIASSHWAVRGAYRRLVIDNLQWLTDPDADKSFKSQARNAKRNGTDFFMPPGALTPSSNKVASPRAPDLSSALGN